MINMVGISFLPYLTELPIMPLINPMHPGCAWLQAASEAESEGSYAVPDGAIKYESLLLSVHSRAGTGWEKVVRRAVSGDARGRGKLLKECCVRARANAAEGLLIASEFM